jgi:hypothetical protein
MSLYMDRIAKGLCGSCGNPNKNGSLCDGCKQKAKERAAAKRAMYRKVDGCLGCGAPVDKGTRCDICKATQKESRAKAVEHRKTIKQCTVCKNPAKPKRTLCQECLDKRSKVSSERYRENKDAGVCPFCRNALEEGQATCTTCLKRNLRYRRKIKKAALMAYGRIRCATCPEATWQILEIDHIHGGGCKHRKSIGHKGGGHNFYLWLRREGYPSGYRVLCPTCNKKAHRGLL